MDAARVDLPQTVSRRGRPISFSELAFGLKTTYRMNLLTTSPKAVETLVNGKLCNRNLFAFFSLTEIRATKNYKGRVIAPRARLFYSGH